MPRVEYTETKGLVQSTGQGFGLNSILTTTQNVQLDGSKSVVIINGAHTVKLPADENAKEGDVIIVLCANTGGSLHTDNASTGTLGLNAVGDMAICVYNGTLWVVGAGGPAAL